MAYNNEDDWTVVFLILLIVVVVFVGGIVLGTSKTVAPKIEYVAGNEAVVFGVDNDRDKAKVSINGRNVFVDISSSTDWKVTSNDNTILFSDTKKDGHVIVIDKKSLTATEKKDATDSN